MMRIELTQNKHTLIDEEDYAIFSKYKWHAHHTKNDYWRVRGASKEGKTIYLHRILMDAPKGLMVDHINGNALDNRRSNLRLATNQQNQANRKGSKKFKGTEKHGLKYRAAIRVDGVSIKLGSFDTEEEAARCYDEGAKEWFGEYACLNFSVETEDE